MINRHATFTASDSIGSANRKLSARPAPGSLLRPRRWLPTTLAATLLAISTSRLAAQTSFVLTGNYPTTTNTVALAVGDINGDGTLDILAAGSLDSSLKALAGDGKGGFASSWLLQFQNPSPFTSVALGDFDRDGKADFLAGRQANAPMLMLSGIGTVAQAANIPGASNGGSDFLAVGDFNRDGKPDFASAGQLTGVSVLLGDGTGKFTESFSTALPSTVKEYLAVGDFNRDGLPDLAVSASAGITVLLGDGTGKFTAAPGGPLAHGGKSSGNVTVGDFNGDGKLDLASASILGVTVLLGDGAGKFTAVPGGPSAPTLGSLNAFLAVADFNGDGLPDLVLTHTVRNSVTVLVGDGTGRFTADAASDPAGTLPEFLAVADFNGDGMPDLAVADKISSTTRALGNVTVLLKNKLAVLTANPHSVKLYAEAVQAAPLAIPVSITSPASGITYTAASKQTWLSPNPTSNVTGAGSSVALKADQASLAAGKYSGTLQVGAPGFFGSSVNVTLQVANPSGTLRTLSSPVVRSNPVAVAVGDVNLDGKPDLAVANFTSNTATVLLGDGTGGFQTASNTDVGVNTSSLVIADFNGDGMPDLAAAGYGGGHLFVWLGDGTGKFTRLLWSHAGCRAMSMAMDDFNGDGKPDLAVQAGDSPNTPTPPLVLLNDGTGGFGPGINKCVYSDQGTDFPASVAAGDFNGDGKPDLVSVGTDGGNVMVQLGDGTGKFTTVPGPSLAGSHPGFVVVEDFNNDGKQDLAVADTLAGVTLLLGDGKGGFQPALAGSFLRSFGILSLAVGDFNGDGRPDLAATNALNGVTVLLGDGTANFTAPSGWFAVGEVNPRLPVSMAVGDFNGDGRPDLAVPLNSGHNVSVLVGEAAITTRSVLSTTVPATFPLGTPIPLNLTVSPAEPAFNRPGGVVTFYEGATPLGELSDGPYTFNVLNLAPGTHTITAKYAGDARSVGSTSNAVTIQVTPGTVSVGPSVSSETGGASPFFSPGLAQNQMLVSPNGRYEARMQSDGNFVVYEEGRPIWFTQTQNRERSPYRLALQPDGNLVVYGSPDKDVTLPGVGVCRTNSACIALWSSGPRGRSAPYTLKMQDDGNLVVYDNTSRAVWDSKGFTNR